MNTPELPLIAAARAPDLSAERPSETALVLAFDEFYASQFRNMIELAAMLCGSVAVAEDIVQEAFAQLYLRSSRVADPAAYVRRSVVNGSIGRFRKHRHEHLVAEHHESATSDDDSAQRLDLTARLGELPARQRAAVVLRIQVGMSEAETAQLIGCRPGTVGSLVHRGLAALRITLQEDQP